MDVFRISVAGKHVFPNYYTHINSEGKDDYIDDDDQQPRATSADFLREVVSLLKLV